VDEYFRIKDSEGNVVKNIFSLGDACISPLKEEKVALGAEISGEFVAKNIALMEKKGNQIPINKLRDLPHTYNIGIGGKNAIFIFENICFSGFLAYVLKIIIERTKVREVRG